MPSIGNLATSPLISPGTLFVIRSISLFAHIVVIILGVYTRKLVFFLQFTNWTNMLSSAYSLAAFLTSYFYALPKFYQDASLTKVNKRTKKSRLATLATRLLQLTLPMHIIVTVVFWNLVYQTANTSNGYYDYIYFLFSHGFTLLFLLFEAMFNKIRFTRRILPVIFAYITIYAVFGLVIFFTTGYAIYDFMDARQKSNRVLLVVIYAVAFFANELVIALGWFKSYLLSPGYRSKLEQRRRRISLRQAEKSYPENSF